MVDQYFMDHFRQELKDHFAERAPNGEPISLYGEVGDKPSDAFMPMRGVEQELFAHFFVHRCMSHMNNYLSEPCRWAWHWIFHSKQAFVPRKIFKESTVRFFAKLADCSMAVITLSAAIALVYRFDKLKYQIIVVVGFGLLFAFEAAFISPRAIHLFVLIAGWVNIFPVSVQV